MGGFATAYDLVSSEYGWSDDEIGNLPLVRFRQITATIQQRRFLATRMENSRFSWLARNITTYIAQGYMLGKNQPNTALDHARQIGYDDIERAFLGEIEDQPTVKENAPGSYERLMAGFHQLDQRGKTL